MCLQALCVHAHVLQNYMCRFGICEERQMFSQRVHGAQQCLEKLCLLKIGVLKPVLPEGAWAVCYHPSPPSSQWIGIQVPAWQTLKHIDWIEYRKTGSTQMYQCSQRNCSFWACHPSPLCMFMLITMVWKHTFILLPHWNLGVTKHKIKWHSFIYCNLFCVYVKAVD